MQADAEVDYLLILRGCAGLGVFFGHMAGIGPLSIGAIVSKGEASLAYVFHDQPYETWRTILEIATPLIGKNFVLLFFVQSGYLMGKLFQEGRYDALTGKARFYWARYLRLAPALYVNLVLCALFYILANPTPLTLAGDFLFLNNFTLLTVNSVTWSLSHEFQYYLLAPFVFLVFRARVAWLAVAIVAAFAIGQWLGPVAYVHVFLIGFAVSLLPRPQTTQRAKNLGLLLGLLAFHLGFNALFFYHYRVSADLWATAISVLLVWQCERPSPATSSPLLRVGMAAGNLTYGFYLWHYVLLMSFRPMLTEWAKAMAPANLASLLAPAIFHGLELAIVLPLAFIIAWICFVFIETRFRPGLYSRADLAGPKGRTS